MAENCKTDCPIYQLLEVNRRYTERAIEIEQARYLALLDRTEEIEQADYVDGVTQEKVTEVTGKARDLGQQIGNTLEYYQGVISDLETECESLDNNCPGVVIVGEGYATVHCPAISQAALKTIMTAISGHHEFQDSAD